MVPTDTQRSYSTFLLGVLYSISFLHEDDWSHLGLFFPQKLEKMIKKAPLAQGGECPQGSRACPVARLGTSGTTKRDLSGDSANKAPSLEEKPQFKQQYRRGGGRYGGNY